MEAAALINSAEAAGGSLLLLFYLQPTACNATCRKDEEGRKLPGAPDASKGLGTPAKGGQLQHPFASHVPDPRSPFLLLSNTTRETTTSFMKRRTGRCPKEEGWVKLFSKALDDRTTSNGWKLTKERSKFLTVRTINQWKDLPSEVVGAPTLEVSCLEQRVGLDDLQGPFQLCYSNLLLDALSMQGGEGFGAHAHSTHMVQMCSEALSHEPRNQVTFRLKPGNANQPKGKLLVTPLSLREGKRGNARPADRDHTHTHTHTDTHTVLQLGPPEPPPTHTHASRVTTSSDLPCEDASRHSECRNRRCTISPSSPEASEWAAFPNQRPSRWAGVWVSHPHGRLGLHEGFLGAGGGFRTFSGALSAEHRSHRSLRSDKQGEELKKVRKPYQEGKRRRKNATTGRTNRPPPLLQLSPSSKPTGFSPLAASPLLPIPERPSWLMKHRSEADLARSTRAFSSPPPPLPLPLPANHITEKRGVFRRHSNIGALLRGAAYDPGKLPAFQIDLLSRTGVSNLGNFQPGGLQLPEFPSQFCKAGPQPWLIFFSPFAASEVKTPRSLMAKQPQGVMLGLGLCRHLTCSLWLGHEGPALRPLDLHTQRGDSAIITHQSHRALEAAPPCLVSRHSVGLTFSPTAFWLHQTSLDGEKDMGWTWKERGVGKMEEGKKEEEERKRERERKIHWAKQTNQGLQRAGENKCLHWISPTAPLKGRRAWLDRVEGGFIPLPPPSLSHPPPPPPASWPAGCLGKPGQPGSSWPACLRRRKADSPPAKLLLKAQECLLGRDFAETRAAFPLRGAAAPQHVSCSGYRPPIHRERGRGRERERGRKLERERERKRERERERKRGGERERKGERERESEREEESEREKERTKERERKKEREREREREGGERKKKGLPNVGFLKTRSQREGETGSPSSPPLYISPLRPFQSFWIIFFGSPPKLTFLGFSPPLQLNSGAKALIGSTWESQKVAVLPMKILPSRPGGKHPLSTARHNVLWFHCWALAGAKNSQCSILSLSEFLVPRLLVQPRFSLYKKLCLFSLETGTLGVTPRMTEASGQAQSDLQLTLPGNRFRLTPTDVFFQNYQPAQRVLSFRTGNENKPCFVFYSGKGEAF
ncbi:Zinc finger CCCH domain-containing protein 13, partial [Ophiophagus hannah]